MCLLICYVFADLLVIYSLIYSTIYLLIDV